MTFKKTLVTFLFLSLLPLEFAFADKSAEQAYQSIGQRRTEYLADKSTLDIKEARQLEQLFLLVDRAAVQRVHTLNWFRSGGVAGKPLSGYNKHIKRVLSEFDFIPMPRRLWRVRADIQDAIGEQHKFFKKSLNEKQQGGMFRVAYGKDALIKSSSAKLVEALKKFREYYPNESEHNKQAIHDHLAALDFLGLKGSKPKEQK